MIFRLHTSKNIGATKFLKVVGKRRKPSLKNLLRIISQLLKRLLLTKKTRALLGKAIKKKKRGHINSWRVSKP